MNWFDFSPRSWGRVWLWTLLGTLLCVSVALYVDSFNFNTLTESARLRAIAMNIILPSVLAAPMLLFFTSKLRELAKQGEEGLIVAHQGGYAIATS